MSGCPWQQVDLSRTSSPQLPPPDVGAADCSALHFAAGGLSLRRWAADGTRDRWNIYSHCFSQHSARVRLFKSTSWVSMTAVMADGCFLTALQPNSSCTAYVLPSDGQSADPLAKVRRVQEQVRMRLAERKSSSLPRLSNSQFGPATGESRLLEKFPSQWGEPVRYLCRTGVWCNLRTSAAQTLWSPSWMEWRNHLFKQ